MLNRIWIAITTRLQTDSCLLDRVCCSFLGAVNFGHRFGHICPSWSRFGRYSRSWLAADFGARRCGHSVMLRDAATLPGCLGHIGKSVSMSHKRARGVVFAQPSEVSLHGCHDIRRHHWHPCYITKPTPATPPHPSPCMGEDHCCWWQFW